MVIKYKGMLEAVQQYTKNLYEASGLTCRRYLAYCCTVASVGQPWCPAPVVVTALEDNFSPLCDSKGGTTLPLKRDRAAIRRPCYGF